MWAAHEDGELRVLVVLVGLRAQVTGRGAVHIPAPRPPDASLGWHSSAAVEGESAQGSGLWAAHEDGELRVLAVLV